MVGVAPATFSAGEGYRCTAMFYFFKSFAVMPRCCRISLQTSLKFLWILRLLYRSTVIPSCRKSRSLSWSAFSFSGVLCCMPSISITIRALAIKKSTIKFPIFFCRLTVTGSFFKKSYHRCFSSGVIFLRSCCAFETNFLLYLYSIFFTADLFSSSTNATVGCYVPVFPAEEGRGFNQCSYQS